MKTLLIIVVLVLLVIGGWVGYKQGKYASNEPYATSTEESRSASFRSLLASGKPYQCTVTQTVDGSSTTGTVFMNDGMLRGEYSAAYSTSTVNVVFLVRDDYTYLWNSALKDRGFKLRNDETATTSLPGEIHASPNTYIDRISDYTCSPWTPDRTKFDIPKNMNFQEL